MTWIAILVANRDNIASLLASVVEHDFENIACSIDGRQRRVDSREGILSVLPKDEEPMCFTANPTSWMFHSAAEPRNLSTSNWPVAFQGLVDTGNIGREFNRIADGVEWALLPWTDDRYLRTVVFVCNSESIFKKCVNAASSPVRWPVPTSSVIATYPVSQQGTVRFQHIVLDEYANDESLVGRTVWNTCGCVRVHPYIKYWDAANLRGTPGCRLLRVNCELVRRGLAGQSLHRVLDEDSFSLLCREALQFDPAGISAIAGDADVETLCSAIVESEKRRVPSFSEIHDELYDVRNASWWYVLRVGFDDGCLSYFTAQTHEQIIELAANAVDTLGPESIVGLY
jgi:hypothetical protein